MKVTRRKLLWLAAGYGSSKLFGQQTGDPSSEPLFIEIPRSKSGIEWVHDNAMSDLRYLPETLGPGCAFLDYDNDGWMDIYLVNSGPS
ncbi:MAG: CRTAC1 family protein, partial [Acidobacteriaceae bacterium]|nr:CRTAC1 family protein [Acidobacteriaceae bacterium]